MRHETVTSDRGTVHYWSTEKQPSSHALVFTHGLTADHTMFAWQVEAFAPLHQVIVWDVPLHGASRPYHPFSYANCAKELLAILDAEGITQAVLVGMSMGGYPSQMFAHQYPSRVAGLVAIDTTPFGLDYYSKGDVWWLQRVGRMAGWFPEALLKWSMAKSVSRSKAAYACMRRMLAPIGKADLIRQMELAYGGFLRENADLHLSCPVLLILGDRDSTGKVSAYNLAWHQRTGYPLVKIPNAAHFSNADQPDAVNAAIKAFVQEISVPKPSAL